MTHWLLPDRSPIPETPSPNESAEIDPTPYQENPSRNVVGKASAVTGSGTDGAPIIRAASGPAMCTDLNDLENCPMVFPPGERPPIGWPQLPPEKDIVAAPKWPPGTPPPFPVFRPTIVEPPVRSPSNVFSPTPTPPVEFGPVGKPRKNY